METIRFQVLVSQILVVLYLLSLLLPSKISAVSDRKNAATLVEINKQGYSSELPPNTPTDGYSGDSGVESSSEMLELCNTDLKTFLPPPYGDISGIVCKPVWNTFILRVSMIYITSNSSLHNI